MASSAGAGGRNNYANIVRYPVLSVLDISQTELIDPDSPDRSTIAHELTGTDDTGIYQAVQVWLEVPNPISHYTPTPDTRFDL